MATYKLIQDIEAEDHILGPLTLRQFIFALGATFFFYLCFISFTKGAAFLFILFGPPGLFCAFFAFPFGKDQSTEVWALAKLRFWFKPRKRIWDQDGMKELVTITVPKKVERVYTDGLSQTEVKSRLQALANTIDSRGWAVKNVNVNAYSYADPTAQQSSDRLVAIDTAPSEVPNYTVAAADDILDERNNPIAQQFQHMITESSQNHHQQLIDTMNAPAAAAQPVATQPAPQQGQPADYWFMNGSPDPAGAQVSLPTPVAGQATAEEEALSQQIKVRNNLPEASYAHLRTLQPLGDQPAVQQTAQPAAQYQQPVAAPQPLPQTDNSVTATPVTAQPDAAILSLANNNDLNVATLARQAHKVSHGDDEPQDEVVISLR